MKNKSIIRTVTALLHFFWASFFGVLLVLAGGWAGGGGGGGGMPYLEAQMWAPLIQLPLLPKQFYKLEIF